MPLFPRSSDEALDEERAQRDMGDRGRRLAAFKFATEGRVWQEQPDSGEWWLVPVIDGAVAN